jgi:hypothetical protein
VDNSLDAALSCNVQHANDYTALVSHTPRRLRKKLTQSAKNSGSSGITWSYSRLPSPDSRVSRLPRLSYMLYRVVEAAATV